MIQTLGTTTNFIIQYEDSFAFAKQRAQALQQKAEGDFATLRGWFQNTTGFGPTNPVTLLVDTKSLASNNGYRTNGTTTVVMNHFNAQGSDPLADDAVLGLFVAEIIEVLMSCRDVQTGKVTWVENHSDGEGLSRMAVGLLHPASYYNATYLGGPYVNGWLQSAARDNWISTNEPTDQDADSFGCSLLFLYWLHSQLGYDMTDIITKAGATLEATYQALTGQSGAYNAFTGFLAPFFPVGETAPLPTDDPFPLLAGTQRTVQLSFTEVSAGLDTEVGHGTVPVSPFIFCPVKDYTYKTLDTPVRLRCVATVTGFAQPVYEWKVNGVIAGTGTITPTATVYTDVPATPGVQDAATETITLQTADIGSTSTYLATSDELDIISGDNLGHEQLIVQVSVREKYASTDTVTTSGTALLDTKEVVYEAQYYVDQAHCKAELQAVIARLQGEPGYNPIPIILTLPDPPPDVYNVVKLIEQMIGEISALATKDAGLANQVAIGLAGIFQVSPRMFGGNAATARLPAAGLSAGAMGDP